MFDGNFRSGVDQVTGPIGATLVRWRVTADVLTATGIALSVACAVAIGSGHLMIGFALLVASALPDLLDGPVAKAAGTQSLRGEFFDSTADRITDSLVLGGMGWYLATAPSTNDLAVMVPFALLGASQLISYMRAKAEIHGFDAKGGLMERAERVVALCIGLVFDAWLVPVLVLVLVLTLITGMQRFVKVWRQATAASPVLAAKQRAVSPLRFLNWNDDDERRHRRWRERMGEQRQARRNERITRPRP